MKTVSTCFVAGRSGGHIIPALTLAQQLIKQDSSQRILFFSANTALDYAIINKSSAVHTHIALNLGTLPGNLLLWPRFVGQFIRSLFTSFTQLRRHRPAKIISTGGYIGIPVCFAAFSLRIPIELIELNAVPGSAIRLLSRLATTIHHCFVATKTYLPAQVCKQADYPVRFAAENKAISPQEARTKLHLDPDKKTLLIVGGSQGSLFINQQIKQLFDYYPNLGTHIQIIHQIGDADTMDWNTWYAQKNIKALVFTYFHGMEFCYRAADVVICRAGAGTLFETIFFATPCITIPLETSVNNHQVDNAYAIAQQYPQQFTVLRQTELVTPVLLLRAVEKFLGT